MKEESSFSTSNVKSPMRVNNVYLKSPKRVSGRGSAYLRIQKSIRAALFLRGVSRGQCCFRKFRPNRKSVDRRRKRLWKRKDAIVGLSSGRDSLGPSLPEEKDKEQGGVIIEIKDVYRTQDRVTRVSHVSLIAAVTDGT